MKLNVKKLLFSLVLGMFFCVCFFAEEAEVVSVKGKVEVSRGDNWIPLNVGDKVNKSEMVSTGFQSEAKIKLGDSILQLGALSRITLESLASSDNRDVVDVYLNTGAVRSKVNHTSDKSVNYTVRNPIAVASVRGTEFLFTDSGNARCLDGAISFAPARYYDKSQLSGGKSVDDVEAPSEGESNAATSAKDISPASPKGSVVILAGQMSSISERGNASAPVATAKNNMQKVKSLVSTAAASENVSTSVSAASMTAISTSGGIIEKPATGSLDVTVKFEE